MGEKNGLRTNDMAILQVNGRFKIIGHSGFVAISASEPESCGFKTRFQGKSAVYTNPGVVEAARLADPALLIGPAVARGGGRMGSHREGCNGRPSTLDRSDVTADKDAPSSPRDQSYVPPMEGKGGSLRSLIRRDDEGRIIPKSEGRSSRGKTGSDLWPKGVYEMWRLHLRGGDWVKKVGRQRIY
ncbi:hypothetical protein AVEN_72739-1 [Araneus ventricosus]|uniref:Uncharacterized protein n=1 Tax=Araneus ventricosus TaxID=182803 RepID=A0A4Y2DQE8_ARAVE|nr:hypothetical protein AVEN_72739-1 [Araneus ventricosus]